MVSFSHNQAVQVLDHDDRLVAGEPGGVAAPGRLAEARVAHLGDDDGVYLRLYRIEVREQLVEVSRHEHTSLFTRPSGKYRSMGGQS
jgi:hypothetical protein